MLSAAPQASLTLPSYPTYAFPTIRVYPELDGRTLDIVLSLTVSDNHDEVSLTLSLPRGLPLTSKIVWR